MGPCVVFSLILIRVLTNRPRDLEHMLCHHSRVWCEKKSDINFYHRPSQITIIYSKINIFSGSPVLRALRVLALNSKRFCTVVISVWKLVFLASLTKWAQFLFLRRYSRQIELWVWPDPSLWKLKVPFICNINHASSGETVSTMYDFAYFALTM